jgi:hypothetical protein
VLFVLFAAIFGRYGSIDKMVMAIANDLIPGAVNGKN